MCSEKTVGAQCKNPSPPKSLSNQRQEGGSKLTKHRDVAGHRRDTRCPLRVAHHWVSDEVLVVSGARSRERAPAATEVRWVPDYKAGPTRGPIWARATGATASHRDKKTRQRRLLRGVVVVCEWVGVCLCLSVTGLNLAETEKPPHPIKGFFRESHKYRGLIFKRVVVMASKWRKWLPCLASKPRDH